MKRNEVIEAYVTEVLRHLPRRDRSGLGVELRGLLTEMLAERGAGADDDAVLAMLREFGTPAEVAARYQPEPETVSLPLAQLRSFVWLSLGGVALQWTLTLPAVFAGQSPAAWWFSWGLGSLWWPGFLALAMLASAWLRERGLFVATPSARTYDPERVNRAAMGFALFGIAVGAALVGSLPWIGPSLPGALPRVLAFDPAFLTSRAWPAPLLWAATFATYAFVLARGRWSTATRHVEMLLGLAFVMVMGWWIVAGPIFTAGATDRGAKFALGFVIALSMLSLLRTLTREGVRIRTPQALRAPTPPAST